MSQSAPSSRAKRSRSSSSKTTMKQTAPPAQAAAPEVSSDQRRAMIAESAYLRAAARGFRGGDPVTDWLASEREVDTLLSGERSTTQSVS